MRRYWLRGCLGVLVVGMLVLVAIWRLSVSSDQAALEHELSLARAEGLPTTWNEFGASIPAALPEKNAAPIYRRIKLQAKDITEITNLDHELALRPTGQVMADAKEILALNKYALSNVDQAAQMPHCWFDRDWNKGMSLLMPELSLVKNGSKLVLLRGSLAAAKGNPGSAIKEVQEAFTISNHIGEEGTGLALSVRTAIYTMGVRHLALWAYRHPKETAYRKALLATLEKYPEPKLQSIHREDLLALRDCLRLSTTVKGRTDLGIKEDKISTLERWMPFVLSRPKADITIARTMRQIWEAYGAPPQGRAAKIEALTNELLPALSAYPIGRDIYLKLTGTSPTDHFIFLYDQVAESRRVELVCLARSLSGSRVPTTLDTHDILSPFDGKPLSYQFDGRQITIEVSCPDQKIKLDPFKFPSDAELTPAN